MQEINTEEYSKSFYDMCEDLLSNFKCVGNWSWGNPSGITGDELTYEINSKYGTVWCTLVEWCSSAGTGINRTGIMTTLPSKKRKPLGQIAEVTIPYFFSRSFNTRAFKDDNHIEIRNYGKFTVGRAGLKKKDFFDYVNRIDSSMVNTDEEGKDYVTVFDIYNDLTKDEFAEQIVKFTLLVENFKQQYRNK